MFLKAEGHEYKKSGIKFMILMSHWKMPALKARPQFLKSGWGGNERKLHHLTTSLTDSEMKMASWEKAWFCMLWDKQNFKNLMPSTTFDWLY